MMSLLINARSRLNLPELFDLMIARTGYKTFIKDNTPEGDERWENLAELRRVTTEFANLEGSEALAQFLENVALVSDVDALGEEGKAPALLTLHTAKGLEFPVVFIVGLEENIFPHSRSLQDPEEMAEERRLAYVGVTRAKDRLYLTRAFRRQTYGFEEVTQPSRFLMDIPPELIDDSAQKKRPAGASPFTTRQAAHELNSRWDRGLGASAPPKPQQAYNPGDRVYHSKFGEGTVISVELTGDDTYVQVAFPNQGIKKLATSIAKLEKRS
jgi:DNA helicase-2/ATP-dependent DNA helicase PcrA